MTAMLATGTLEGSLGHAVLTTTANGLADVTVVDRASDRPLGMLSVLDVARAPAGVASPGEEG
jgi:CBS domain-containing protein